MDAVKGFIPDKLPWWQTGIEVLDTSKGIYIMEKKTRKMTKAEAFEYVKDKKILCCGKGKELQEKLFSLGYKWNNGKTDIFAVEIIFTIGGGISFTVDPKIFAEDYHKELLVEDVLAIELIPEGLRKESLSYEKVVELAKPLMDYLRRVEASERICVTQENVVSEPMPTLISGDMKAC